MGVASVPHCLRATPVVDCTRAHGKLGRKTAHVHEGDTEVRRRGVGKAGGGDSQSLADRMLMNALPWKKARVSWVGCGAALDGRQACFVRAAGRSYQRDCGSARAAARRWKPCKCRAPLVPRRRAPSAHRTLRRHPQCPAPQPPRSRRLPQIHTVPHQRPPPRTDVEPCSSWLLSPQPPHWR